jgi:hypothetical protein
MAEYQMSLPPSHSPIKVAMLGDYPRDPMRIDGGVQAATKYLVDSITQSEEIELHVFDPTIDAPRCVAASDRLKVVQMPRHRGGALTHWRNEVQTLSKYCQGFLPILFMVRVQMAIDAKFRTKLIERLRQSVQSQLIPT